ncbi:MAG: S1C family serine protease [Steroidobacteraceae bacterium]
MSGSPAANRIVATLKFILTWVMVGLAAAFVAVLLRPQWLGLSPVSSADTTTTMSAPASFADAVARAAPAVVNIFTARLVTESAQSSTGSPPDKRGQLRQGLETGLGSGVIVDIAGHVITNDHVVACAQEIYVQLADGRIEEAKVVGTDPATDIAVLQIQLNNPPIALLGQSDGLRTGDIVLAIGTPYGLSQTVTQGIVSAIGRGQLGVSAIEGFIQTDAAINEGNSGGALINTNGELIGINTAVLARNLGVSGISFAIPVNLVRGVMDAILRDGRVKRGWFGVEITEANQVMRIKQVYTDSPAAKAGLQPGDIITLINGAPRSWSEALNLVASTPAGERISLSVLRKDTRFDFTVTLVERKAADDVRNSCTSFSQ